MSEHQIISDLALSAQADKTQRATPTTEDALTHPEIKKRFPDAMEVFIAWERLRLIYNAMLFVVVLVRVTPLGVLFMAPFLLEPAVIANLCFCAGSVGEGYLCLLGIERRFARWAVFILGTLAAVGLAWYFMEELVKTFPDK
jgi:hypothetical protein